MSIDENRRSVRSVSGTALYDTAQGLYSVLVGLAVTDPLKDAAMDINRQPLHGNWTLRLLTATLLVLAGVWLHVGLAAFRLHVLIGDRSERHPTLPGRVVTGATGYLSALAQFWLGIVQLVVIACMAYSIPDVKRFFVGTMFYAGTVIAYELPFLSIRVAYVAVRPWRLLAQLWADRHLPVTDDDMAVHGRRDTEATKNLLAATALYQIVVAVVFLMVAVTCLALAIRVPALASWISLFAFVSVAALVILDYLIFPQFYAL